MGLDRARLAWQAPSALRALPVVRIAKQESTRWEDRAIVPSVPREPTQTMGRQHVPRAVREPSARRQRRPVTVAASVSTASPARTAAKIALLGDTLTRRALPCAPFVLQERPPVRVPFLVLIVKSAGFQPGHKPRRVTTATQENTRALRGHLHAMTNLPTK